MKKLMIAMTMSAICFSSAVADESVDIVYEVKCSAKTTTAKSVTPSKTNYVVNFGMNAKKDGVFWYMDDAISQNADNPENGDVGEYLNVISYDDGFKASRGHFTPAFEALAPEAKLEVVKLLSYDVVTKKTAYNYKSANKWCATVKFTVVPDQVCYKVTSTEKPVGYLVERNGCCGDGAEPELLWSNDDTFEDLIPVSVIQYNRFNGSTEDKANKTELLFGIDGVMMIGGFGSYSVKNGYMTSFSGYVLGVMDSPCCTSCCSASEPAIAHTVCGDKICPDTKVAVGTVSMKFNPTLTKKLNEL